MIYFFDINLKLKKIVNPDNALSAIHEHELNNHIIGSMVMDMSYAKTFIDDVDHFGYYYKGNFYLHRIRRVEDSHISETVTVTGRHIFFEDMLYGLPIDDFRPQNRDAAYILKNTIDTNTRWRTVMTDVTGTLSTNFYRQVPWDVIEWVTENFRVEFEPVILFDGQKINGYQLHVANKLGVNKHKRIPFSRVTELDYEIDYSEIITSLAGYGKGEEVGEGYGRRINIADVDFSRNGVVSPIGSHYMEDRNITAIYGKDNGEPKYGIVEFSDIEDDELLAEAMYESYLEMSRPKMAFSASVIDVGDVAIGDTQVIVRPESNVFYSVRIHKLSANLHDPEDADVELGDYEHFKESKVERKSRQADKEWKKRYASAVEQMRRDWTSDYEGMKEQIKQGYEQAVIDANASIQASEVRMQDELDTQRQQMTENINTARDDAIEQAEADAKAKTDAVQGNLEAFEQTHQQLYDEVTGDIMDIDTFLGDKTISLSKQFEDMETGINEDISVESGRIDAIVTNFDGKGKSLSQFVIDVESIEQTVAANDEWLGTHGSNVLQTVDGFDQKVWLSDVAEINPNLIPFADVSDKDNINRWTGRGFPTSHHIDSYGEFNIESNAANSTHYIGVISSQFELVEGRSYTLSVIVRTSENWGTMSAFGYTYLMRDSGNNTYLGYPEEHHQIDATRSLKVWRFTADQTEDVGVLIGTYTTHGGGEYARFSFKEPKLEEGTERTLFMNAFSNIEQKANELSLKVQEITSGADGEQFLTESDITISSDRVLIGSTSIGSSTLASIISVSPTAVDIITDELNLTGNLNVSEQIESLAVSAVTGSFAEIFASTAYIGFITGDHIDTNSIRSKHIFVEEAMVEDIMAKNMFADNVKTLGIEAIYADLRSVNSEIMTSNIIKSNWLNVDTALFQRFTANEAFIDRLTVKAANVRDLEAITVDAVQANITTVMNSMGEVEGGLTIRRHDGAMWVENGVPKGFVPIQVYDSYADSEIEFTGLNFVTQMSHWKNFKYFYTPHQGRTLRVVWAAGLQGPSTSEYIEVGVETFSNYSPINNGIGTSSRREVVRQGETTYITQDIPMPPPNYEMTAANLRFRRSPDGTNINNRVFARLLFVGQYG